MSEFLLSPGTMTLDELKAIARNEMVSLKLSPKCYAAIDAAHDCVKRVLTEGRIVYGVNTGFGLLANTRIHPEELELLQRSIVLSHAAGVGKPIDNSTVRLILALKINSLARGYSGVRRELIDALVVLFNQQIYHP
jgi:histidine ammonia-lyase